MKVKELLKKEDYLKMGISDVYRYYFPEAKDDEINFYVWECTPWPFSVEITIKLIYEKYLASL